MNDEEKNLIILFLSRQVKVGDPNNPDNMLGALVSKEHLAKVRLLTRRFAGDVLNFSGHRFCGIS